METKINKEEYICQSCKENPSGGIHLCPLKECVYGQDNHEECNCCIKCEKKCTERI